MVGSVGRIAARGTREVGEIPLQRIVGNMKTDRTHATTSPTQMIHNPETKTWRAIELCTAPRQRVHCEGATVRSLHHSRGPRLAGPQRTREPDSLGKPAERGSAARVRDPNRDREALELLAADLEQERSADRSRTQPIGKKSFCAGFAGAAQTERGDRSPAGAMEFKPPAASARGIRRRD
jgi:hypothetical protein